MMANIFLVVLGGACLVASHGITLGVGGAVTSHFGEKLKTTAETIVFAMRFAVVLALIGFGALVVAVFN